MESEEPIDDLLQRLQQSLLKEIDINSLIARNRIAHKWKATYRSILLREVVFWRTADLLHQSNVLQKMGHLLGARILLRSALETVAVLSYLNQKTDDLIERKLSFSDWCKLTTQLLFGSKDQSTEFQAVNILTVMDRCNRRYETVKGYYDTLSESAHPNLDGMLMGYAIADEKAMIESFSNRWADLYASTHEGAIRAVAMTFEFEYNESWTGSFEALEKFLVENDAELEASRSKEK